MSKKRIYLYDTTNRDGNQAEGVNLSVKDKQQISTWLDELGVAYNEGGWPGANPTDTDFFANPPQRQTTRFTSFGMTCKVGKSFHEDQGLQKVLKAPTDATALVGKSWDQHVTEALKTDLQSNLTNIHQTIKYAKAHDKEILFDAEHFFDGYKSNPDYALKCLKAAHLGGANWLVLCDTNGGTLPHKITEAVEAVKKEIPTARLGIHAHNDKNMADANSLAAVMAGCEMVQCTMGGIGERCGNTNLFTIAASLHEEGYDTGLSDQAYQTFAQLNQNFHTLINKASDKHEPYVGSSAFAHKGGLHASAVEQNPNLYEHTYPTTYGNKRKIVVSSQAGLSNVRAQLIELGIEAEEKDPALPKLLADVKKRESEGYSYEAAPASFAMLALKHLGQTENLVSIKKYKTLKEGIADENNEIEEITSIKLTMQRDSKEVTCSIQKDKEGTVHAFDKALRRALNGSAPELEHVRLRQYKVRSLNGGKDTDAKTRVWIEVEDKRTNRRWATVGVSSDVIGASRVALVDAYNYHLCQRSQTKSNTDHTLQLANAS